jgi:hypothetical protein
MSATGIWFVLFSVVIAAGAFMWGASVGDTLARRQCQCPGGIYEAGECYYRLDGGKP